MESPSFSVDDLVNWELCERRMLWTRQYSAFRISPLVALYQSVDAGLRSDADPETTAQNLMMELAASPGLDVQGCDVYDIAVHFAALAGILAHYLRAGQPPWEPVRPGKATHPVILGQWLPTIYDLPDGRIRRVVFVDHWSDDRREAEVRSWRSVGEICALNRPMLLNALVIGHVMSRHRISPWTRAFVHPRNGHIRFKRKTYTAQEFSTTWRKKWREQLHLSTKDWLDQMQRDQIFEDLVHTLTIPIPPRAEEFRQDLFRMIGEMKQIGNSIPPMRRSGCFGFSPCPFLKVCHGAKPPIPESYGFRRK